MKNKASFTIEEVSSIFSDGQTSEPYYAGTYRGEQPGIFYPKRANYYGLAICLKGSIEMTANLDGYQLNPGTLIVLPPEIIRNWNGDLEKYEEATLLFSDSIFEDELILKSFRFFNSDAVKTVELNKENQKRILSLIQEIKTVSHSQSKRKDKIVVAYISIVLNLIADLYDEYYPIQNKKISASVQIEQQFKKLLLEKYNTIHSVQEYANRLNVSAKHLSETLKENTGKTAGQWIKEYIILEAKVRLKQTNLNISQIANLLQFNDATVFGKFFKKNTGITPGNYRKISKLN